MEITQAMSGEVLFSSWTVILLVVCVGTTAAVIAKSPRANIRLEQLRVWKMLLHAYWRVQRVMGFPSIRYHFFLWQGNHFAKRKDILAAVTAYSNAYKLKPNLPFSIYDELKEAVKPQEQECDATSETRSSLEVGRETARQGDLDQAITIYNDIISSHPQFVPAYRHLGDALYEKGLVKDSEGPFRVAIALSRGREDQERFEDLVRSTSTNNIIIITHVANNYFPMFKIWYAYFSKMNISNLLVIALDPIVNKKLIDLGARTYLVPLFSYQPNVREFLWLEMVKLRKRINAIGVTYLHSDIDAFWLRNPIELMWSIPADIVGSIGYGTPSRLVNKWGFVLCCGFYSMKANQNTKPIFDKYIAYTRLYEHDQNGLNRLLYRNGIIWENLDDSSKRGRCHKLHLDVHVMPDEIVTRDPACLKNTSLPYIFHPSLGKGSMDKKIEQLETWGIHA